MTSQQANYCCDNPKVVLFLRRNPGSYPGFFMRSPPKEYNNPKEYPMKYDFKLADFPLNEFEMETSVWTGKSKLFQNGIAVTQSTEKGKPFLISGDDGQLIKAYPKGSFPDFAPVLVINGRKNRVVDKLKTIEYIVGAFPIVLLLIGGVIGGAIGAAATVGNYTVFRLPESTASRYLKVVGISILAFVAYFMVAAIMIFLL